MWPLTAQQIAELVGGELRGDAAAVGVRALTDSRAGVREGDVFFGLVGPHFDGGRFAEQVLAEGAAVAVVGEALEALQPAENQAVVVVEDPLAALQALAAEARHRFGGTLVAITGSNGKTTVKDMLLAALGGSRRVAASPLSYNSQVGVALSLLQLDSEAEVALVECGISLPGEMARIEAMVRPDLGILVNVGDAHLEGLGSREVTAREKAGLFRRLDDGAWVLVPAAERLARTALAALGAPVVLVAEAGAALTGAPGAAAEPSSPQDDGVVSITSATSAAADGGADARRAQEVVPKTARSASKGVEGGSREAGEARTAGPIARGSAGDEGDAAKGASVEVSETGRSAVAAPPFLLLDDRAPRLRHGAVEVALVVAPRPLLMDAALAAAAALLLGAEPQAVEEGLAHWTPAPMRLEISTTPRGVLLINDAYTADPTSFEVALAALARERRGGSETVAVLGGMAQLGKARGAAHRRVGRRVAELGIDRLVTVGEGGAEIAAAARAAGMDSDRVHPVADVGEAALLLDERCRPGDRVLLKASRPERLERIASLFFDALASARLYIDLDAIVGNYRRLRRAAGGRAVMAVVKSFGYGLDAVRVARALERAGVDYFAVAYPDEGVLLRDHDITAPILVSNVLQHEVEKIVRLGLTAQVSAAQQVGWLEVEGARQQRAVRVHLKVDTGMGRAGVAAGEALALAQRVAASEWLLLEGLMTHFAAAEDPAQDPFTRRQIAAFDAVRQALAEAGLAVKYEHAANSAAIARFPEAHYSMVRSGLALFGYSDVQERVELGQQPVLRLSTQVISVKRLPAGHAVGYGRTWEVDDGGRTIAVVAIGYSDGYPWALSNRGWMAVAGKRCPVAGRVSMDVTTLDVTACGDSVAPGDEVVVFGPGEGEPSLLELAERAGTIPYELLTRISPRVRRIFRTSH